MLREAEVCHYCKSNGSAPVVVDAVSVRELMMLAGVLKLCKA